MYAKVKDLIYKAVHSEGAKRVFHTFWQAAGGVLLSGLLASRSSTDVKLALGAALAAGLAALKAAYLARS